MDALAGLCVEDVSWHTPGRNPLSGHYLGREATFDSFAREFELSGGTYQVDVHDVLANDQHTVALLHASATRAGTRLDQDYLLVFHVRVGKDRGSLGGLDRPGSLRRVLVVAPALPRRVTIPDRLTVGGQGSSEARHKRIKRSRTSGSLLIRGVEVQAVACRDRVHQCLQLRGRGAFDHACHQRCRAIEGESQARIARNARGQEGAAGGAAARAPPLSAAGCRPRCFWLGPGPAFRS
jgi:SnoaL-like domain